LWKSASFLAADFVNKICACHLTPVFVGASNT
jgi:hypothetical protein